MESDYACSPVFDDRIIRLIVLSLPEGGDPRRKELLPQVLRDWAKNELQAHLSQEPYAVIKERRERVKSVGDRARGLLEALEAIDSEDQWEIAMHMPRKAGCHWPKMHGHPWWERAETRGFVQRIKDEREFLTALASAAPATWSRPPKQPPTASYSTPI
jgi:hypothetical protein